MYKEKKMNSIISPKFKKSTKAFAVYFWNRLHGEKYGKAILNQKKVRIVPSKEIQKFLKDIEQYGYPRNGVINPLSQPKMDELIRRVSPIIKSDERITDGVYNYTGMSDRLQVYDSKAHIQRLFLMEEAPNPTRDFLRYILNLTSKNIL